MDTHLGAFTPVRSALSTLVYPIQVVASLPSDGVDWLNELLQDRTELKVKNSQLESENLLHSVRLQKMKSLERENMRLRELLGSSFRLSKRVKSAEVVAVDLAPFSQKVVIDKGHYHGVFVGQPVLDSTGVMGQVIRVNHFSSDVVLLTNPNHALPVQVNRNGLRAVAAGSGADNLLQLDYLLHDADIRIGDILMTSGLGGRFPAGYPVGEIVSIDTVPGHIFSTIKVKPQANIATSRHVLLVLEGESIENRPLEVGRSANRELEQ